MFSQGTISGAIKLGCFTDEIDWPWDPEGSGDEVPSTEASNQDQKYDDSSHRRLLWDAKPYHAAMLRDDTGEASIARIDRDRVTNRLRVLFENSHIITPLLVIEALTS